MKANIKIQEAVVNDDTPKAVEQPVGSFHDIPYLK